MSPDLITQFQIGGSLALERWLEYLPRIIGAALLFLLGLFLARFVKHLVIQGLSAMKFSASMEKTPLGLFLKNAEIGHRFEDILGSVVYWLLILIFTHAVVSILGLVTLVAVFDKIFAYLPHILMAGVIFICGVVLAGLIESMVKGLIATTDVSSSRLIAKVASYLVLTIAALAAVTELGIASEFIRIMFIGVIATLSIGTGLAIGLGGKDVAAKMIGKWYDQMGKKRK